MYIDFKELSEFLHEEIRELTDEYNASVMCKEAFKPGKVDDDKLILDGLKDLEAFIDSEANDDIFEDDIDFKNILFIVDEKMDSYNNSLNSLVDMKILTNKNVIAKYEHKIDTYEILHKILLDKVRSL